MLNTAAAVDRAGAKTSCGIAFPIVFAAEPQIWSAHSELVPPQRFVWRRAGFHGASGLCQDAWNERFQRIREAHPVNETSQDNSVWDSIPVGDDLGVMDYVMTEKMIADYREVVGNPTAAYPTVAARHPANLFYRKYRSVMRVPNTGHDSQFFNPPIAGKRIFVKAHVADKYIRREKTYLIIEATATDEDGRLIEISRLVGLARPTTRPALADVASKWEKK